MNLLKTGLLGVLGISFGMLSSAGVFTVLATIGLIPRFAGRMHVAKHVLLLENMVILGTITGCVISLYDQNFRWNGKGLGGEVLLAAFGFFGGIFIGALALAIAEMLNSIPIFSRRVGFKKGLSIAIAAMAVGKIMGSLWYFAKGIYEWGGGM